MKNLITLKKFCLVVAIVGLLHTIVDAEQIRIPNTICWKTDTDYIADIVYNTDLDNAAWNLEDVLKHISNPDKYQGWEIVAHGMFSRNVFLGRCSDVVVDIFDKHGEIDILGEKDIRVRFTRLVDGQVYVSRYRRKK